MEHRTFAALDRQVSSVGLGTWQIGADWGTVDEVEAMSILEASAANGVRFFDTADVYGDGRSERLIGEFLRSLGENDSSQLTVVTKMGRRVEQVPEEYNIDNFRTWLDRSRQLLGHDTLDLVQLHCPPNSVYGSDQVYDALDTLVEEERIKSYGVSVETCAQALEAMKRPNLASVQIVLNAFRMKPLEQVLPKALERDVAIIARVPLASGLLTGKITSNTQFESDDHRNYNRHGEAFDIGETFSGVPFETGLRVAQRFVEVTSGEMSPSEAALRWVLDQPGVTTVIPGASSTSQAVANAQVGSLPSLEESVMASIASLYEEEIKGLIHDRW